MKTIHQEREEFGAWARSLRHEAGLSLREIETETGITYSMVSAIECGERAVGSEVAGKLANALKLNGEERDQFLMKAAGTRKKDRLLGCCRALAPEVVNYVARALVSSGIVLDDIDSCLLRKTGNQNVKDRSEDELVIGLKDGRSIVCGLVIAQGS